MCEVSAQATTIYFFNIFFFQFFQTLLLLIRPVKYVDSTTTASARQTGSKLPLDLNIFSSGGF